MAADCVDLDFDSAVDDFLLFNPFFFVAVFFLGIFFQSLEFFSVYQKTEVMVAYKQVN